MSLVKAKLSSQYNQLRQLDASESTDLARYHMHEIEDAVRVDGTFWLRRQRLRRRIKADYP
jgi:hypothetical protein